MSAVLTAAKHVASSGNSCRCIPCSIENPLQVSNFPFGLGFLLATFSLFLGPFLGTKKSLFLIPFAQPNQWKITIASHVMLDEQFFSLGAVVPVLLLFPDGTSCCTHSIKRKT